MKKLILLLFIPLVFACSGGDGDSDNPNNPCPNQPQLTTFEVSNISIDENTGLASATFSGEIQNIQLGASCETFSITNQGFVYSTNIQPTTIDNVVNANGENASANVSDLMPETTYYVRSYLINTLGTFYGNEVSFTTPELNNPVYLDTNGVTIKARDWAELGMTGIINGKEYTIVNEEMLRSYIAGILPVNVCTTMVENMRQLFCEVGANSLSADYINFISDDLASWDVSNVTNMRELFCGGFTGPNNYFNPDLSFWDVSSVTNMKRMLQGVADFSQDLSNWDVSNVNYMTGLFSYTYTNPDIPNWSNWNISNWNVSNVYFMSSMFENCSFNGDLSNWDVSNVTDMDNMFAFSSFNQPLNDWDVSNVNNMGAMFANLCIGNGFNQDISNWDVSNVTIMGSMFRGSLVFNQDLSNWNVSNVSNCENFCSDNGEIWTLPKPNFTNCSDDLGCN